MQMRDRESRVAEAKLRTIGLEAQVQELYSNQADVRDLGDGLVTVHAQYLEEIRALNLRLSQMQELCAA